MAVGAKIISRRAQFTSPSDADGGCSACGAGDRTSIWPLVDEQKKKYVPGTEVPWYLEKGSPPVTALVPGNC